MHLNEVIFCCAIIYKDLSRDPTLLTIYVYLEMLSEII